MNWFKRHLNWTLTLTLLVALLFVSTTTGAPAITEFMVRGIATIASFAVAGWVIRQKGRSLGWLLMGLIPFGFVSWFFLKERELYDVKGGKVVRIPRDKND